VREYKIGLIGKQQWCNLFQARQHGVGSGLGRQCEHDAVGKTQSQ